MVLTNIDLKYVSLIYRKIRQKVPNGKGLRKLGRDEQHIARTRIKAFWPNPPRDGSRAGQKIGHEAPFFRPKGYSNKPFMHSNCLIAPVRRLFHYDVTIKWPVKWLIGCDVMME